MFNKMLGGLGYLSWIICNLALLYGIGIGAVKLIELHSIGKFLLFLGLGLILLYSLLMMSVLLFLLITQVFIGDDKANELVDKYFPFIKRFNE